MNFDLTLVAWGKEYVRSFLDVVIPNLLAEGNVPDFEYRESSVFRIYSHSDDLLVMMNSPQVERLKKWITIEFNDLSEIRSMEGQELPGFSDNRKYDLMNLAHYHAVSKAEEREAYLLFLFPDHVYPRDSFKRFAQYARENKKVIMIGGIRTIKEEVTPILMDICAASDDGTIDISGRQLVALILKHPHAIAQSLFWDGPFSSRWPSHLYWMVGDEGLLMRGFLLHPVMVKAQRHRKSTTSTIDADYFSSVVEVPGDIYVVEDSDELVCLEFTTSQLEDKTRRTEPQSYFRVAHWVKEMINDYLIYLVCKRIRFHVGPCLAAWEGVERRSQVVVEQILRELRALIENKISGT